MTGHGASGLAVDVSSAPDVSRQTAAAVLGGLAAVNDGERATLPDATSGCFDAEGSVAQAARTLVVHPSTVHNRHRRVEELTSRSFSDTREAAERSPVLIADSQQGTAATPRAPTATIAADE